MKKVLITNQWDLENLHVIIESEIHTIAKQINAKYALSTTSLVNYQEHVEDAKIYQISLAFYQMCFEKFYLDRVKNIEISPSALFQKF